MYLVVQYIIFCTFDKIMGELTKIFHFQGRMWFDGFSGFKGEDLKKGEGIYLGGFRPHRSYDIMVI